MDFNPLSTCIFLYFSWHVTQIFVKPGKYPSEGVTIGFNREGGLEVRAVLLHLLHKTERDAKEANSCARVHRLYLAGT